MGTKTHKAEKFSIYWRKPCHITNNHFLRKEKGFDSNLDVGKGAMRQRPVERRMKGCDFVASH